MYCNSSWKYILDTWILPMVQMGQLGIEQDAQITDKLLSEAPRGSRLAIATGYFNLTTQYMNTLIQKSQAQCDILMAHPKVSTIHNEGIK